VARGKGAISDLGSIRKRSMRVLTLCAALFCLLISVASFAILYVVPETAISRPEPAGSLLVTLSDWVVPSLLIFGVVANAAILVSLRNPRSFGFPRATTTLALVTVALSIVDFVLSRAHRTAPQIGFPWLDVSLIAACGLYLLYARASRTARDLDAA
jgi:pilus assembly protein TadC